MDQDLSHVESPTLRSLLLGEIQPTPDLVRMALDLTWLQNEYSERCDGEDFAVDRWEDMQEALRAADEAFRSDGNMAGCILGLRGYWARWQRFSSNW